MVIRGAKYQCVMPQHLNWTSCPPIRVVFCYVRCTAVYVIPLMPQRLEQLRING